MNKQENIGLKDKFQSNSGIYLNDEGMYDKINNIRLKEQIGTYYQEEAGSSEEDLEEEESNTPDANKETKRVITYSAIN